MECIKKGYWKTDDAVNKKNLGRESGSTAVTAVLVNEKGVRSVYVANIGDTSAMLVRNGQGMLVTEEHKAKSSKERERVIANGGTIEGGRIMGEFDLAVTRAFGDFLLKKWVIPEPYVNKIELTAADSYLLLASDGLWDSMSLNECTELLNLNAGENVLRKTQLLLDECILKGSTDNITIILVEL
jgi:serine/threonine protein phosphatase PrpC